ncbi:extracellular solute-binding protein [Nonomuraea sp. NPDC046570]|uniref:ABC transporter substrate-binding protein n=1 Tax=Nonomuraea sp. NPDC046570 TaxID=3155255 RepID=UPI0033FF04D7
MLHHKNRRLARTAMAGIVALTVGACSPGQPATKADQNAKVTIHVGNMPTKDNPDNLALFNKQIAAFQKLHPNVTVIGEETKFDPQTFAALVAGGSMPTTMQVPYTNIQQLAVNGQVRDITDLVKGDEVLSRVNPDVAKQTRNAEGRTFGVVTAAYTMAFIYNRSLYKKAGLDPDAPPKTWQEVRDNAKAISKASDAAGFTIATTTNSGGWILATMAYGHGSTIQKREGDAVKASVNSSGVKEALTFLRDVRWADQAAGENFLMNQDDMRNAIAAGRIGQTVLGADLYRDLVGNRDMPGADLGIAPLPQSSTGIGTLGGGDIAVASPKASASEAAAALEWVKFRYLGRFLNQEAVVEWAETSKTGGLPVGAPEVPLFSAEIYDRYLKWIADYVNVERANYTAYFASLGTLPILGEPPVAAQETYALLDAVTQQVLTKQDADIDAALTQLQTDAQALIDAAQ